MLEFEWDADKAAANLLKHGVSFDEARTVFGDLLATTVFDVEHSTFEDRWLTMGVSSSGRVIVVWHTDRDAKTRIIGAREATAYERRVYAEGR